MATGFVHDPQAGGSPPDVSATSTAEDAKRAAREAGAELKAQARDAAETMKEQVRQGGERARQMGADWLEQGKGRVQRELASYRDATRRAAAKLEGENDTNLASWANQAADLLDRAEEGLKSRDLNRLIDDAGAAARKQPELFYGGMFVAGLALARFLKASSRREYAGVRPYTYAPSHEGSRASTAAPAGFPATSSVSSGLDPRPSELSPRAPLTPSEPLGGVSTPGGASPSTEWKDPLTPNKEEDLNG